MSLESNSFRKTIIVDIDALFGFNLAIIRSMCNNYFSNCTWKSITWAFI